MRGWLVCRSLRLLLAMISPLHFSLDNRRSKQERFNLPKEIHTISRSLGDVLVGFDFYGHEHTLVLAGDKLL